MPKGAEREGTRSFPDPPSPDPTPNLCLRALPQLPACLLGTSSCSCREAPPTPIACGTGAARTSCPPQERACPRASQLPALGSKFPRTEVSWKPFAVLLRPFSRPRGSPVPRGPRGVDGSEGHTHPRRTRSLSPRCLLVPPRPTAAGARAADLSEREVRWAAAVLPPRGASSSLPLPPSPVSGAMSPGRLSARLDAAGTASSC